MLEGSVPSYYSFSVTHPSLNTPGTNALSSLYPHQMPQHLTTPHTPGLFP